VLKMVIGHRPAIAPVPAGQPRQQTSRSPLLRSQVYEITFEGRAGHVLRAEFDDCEVSLGQDTTTLRVELPGQPALWGIIERMMEFGLRLIALRLLTVPHVASWDGSTGQGSPAG
jgi:hypothetical protein